MPTDLGRAYDSSFIGTPPHMSSEDYEIWQRLWPRIKDEVTRLYFDVGLGDGRAAAPGTREALAAMWTRLNQKRADVILEYPAAVTILELRNAAQANAIGRLQMYAMLWNEAPPIRKPLTLWLATNTRDLDVERLADRAGIRYSVL